MADSKQELRSLSNDRVSNSANIFRQKSKKHLSIGQYIVGKFAAVTSVRQESRRGHFWKGKTRKPHNDRRKGTFLANSQVAVKILEKEKIKEVSDVERVAREIHILKMIRHPNIIQLYEVRFPSLTEQIIETPKQIYLIMEYCAGGELFDHIVKRTRMHEFEACKIY